MSAPALSRMCVVVMTVSTAPAAKTQRTICTGVQTTASATASSDALEAFALDLKAPPERPSLQRSVGASRHGDPNQVASASRNPVSVPSPTQATFRRGESARQQGLRQVREAPTDPRMWPPLGGLAAPEHLTGERWSQSRPLGQGIWLYAGTSSTDLLRPTCEGVSRRRREASRCVARTVDVSVLCPRVLRFRQHQWPICRSF